MRSSPFLASQPARKSALAADLRAVMRRLFAVVATAARARPGGGSRAAAARAAPVTEPVPWPAREFVAFDALTGALSREGLFAACAVAGVRPATLAVVDCERLGQVNELLGRDLGDRVLRSVATRLGQHLAQGDHLARWGGDCFVILFAGSARSDAEDRVARAQASLADSPVAMVDNAPVAIRVAFTTVRGVDRRAIEGAVREADEELYARKLVTLRRSA